MNTFIKNKKVKYFTIEQIDVNWKLSEDTLINYNKMNSKLGVGKGHFLKNGKIFINSTHFGEKDQFIQLVYENSKNFSLEVIFSDFYHTYSTYSGVLYDYFGLVVNSFKIKPLSKKEYDNIHYSYLKYSD